MMALDAHSPDTLHLSPRDIATLEAALDREPRVVPGLAALIDRYGDPEQVGDPDRQAQLPHGGGGHPLDI